MLLYISPLSLDESRIPHSALVDHISDLRLFNPNSTMSWWMPDSCITDTIYLSFCNLTAGSYSLRTVLESGFPQAMSVFNTFSLRPPFSSAPYQKFTLRSRISRSSSISTMSLASATEAGLGCGPRQYKTNKEMKSQYLIVSIQVQRSTWITMLSKYTDVVETYTETYRQYTLGAA